MLQSQTISLTITLLSGLHIGAGNEAVKIGGVDSPVIKNPLTDAPYIPGSSIKGKLRCLLEQSKDVALEGDEDINKFFGSSAGKVAEQITKILVRDFHMIQKWQDKFQNFQEKGKSFTEEKTEITIDRETGTSKAGLRNIERVPAGVQFAGNIIIRYESKEELAQIQDILQKAFNYLENDALGGSGSRGYGAVKIECDFDTV